MEPTTLRAISPVDGSRRVELLTAL